MQHYQAAGFDPLGPTAAQIAAFLYELLILMACRHRLSRVTGPVKPQSLAAWAGQQKSRLRLSQIATSLQLFNKADLQAFMKAGRHLYILLSVRPLSTS